MSAVIKLEAIEKTYFTGEVDVKAVRGVSLEVQKGEFVAFMGSSGSGKSTIMNLLGCLDRPTKGRYLLDGIDVSKLGRDELATIRNRKLGFVFQSFNLLSRTSALENVELPLLYSGRPYTARELKEKAQKALEIVGLAKRAAHHPNELSGGQQQRVAIARALIAGPRIILADEPTGNLDSGTAADIMNLLKVVNESRITILMVTHEYKMTDYATRVIHFKDGLAMDDQYK